MNTQDLIAKNLIVRHLGGSHAYGMSTPQSDVDYRGIFFAPEQSVRTPFFNIKHVTDTTEEDTSFLELNHFMKLVTDCNPNVLETLWVDKKDIQVSTLAYELLRSHRSDLLSKKAAFTFTGYAFSQLKRIRGHNKWINNAQPEAAPMQIEYVSLVQNFTEDKVFKINLADHRDGWILYHFGGEIYGLYEREGYTAYNRDGTLNPFKAEQVVDNPFIDETGQFRKTPHFIVKFNKESYVAARDTHKNYWHWKTHRNEKRSELEELHGYDTKHAAHLVRLLRMGTEILETGEVHVWRPDAQELLDIRAGKWKYDDIVAYAESLDANIRENLYNTSQLRHSPDYKLAARLLMDAQDICWSKR